MSSYGFLFEGGEQMEALLAQLQAKAPPGWRPHRLLFRNFWFFQREEFLWHHGRLFLGGQNAAGKSTVLSMAIPFLLDGNKAEERLNTFGGHGRHMAYYVTGSPTPDDASEAAYFHRMRTSYLALEFCRRGAQGEENYVTVGQGLHHDREAEDKSVKSWGFVITDGRRIGRRQRGQLFDVIKENLTCLSKAELKKLLENGGEVFETNVDYKRAVNRLLFGFKDLRDYDEMIDLLLKIRRPKLTKEMRPRDVAEILTNSLPSLNEAIMQVTASSLDHIDQTTQNIERLAQQLKDVAELDRAVQTVFRRVAEGAAADLLRQGAAADAAAEKLRLAEADLEGARAALAKARAGLGACRQTVEALTAEKGELEGQAFYRAADELTAVQQKLYETNKGLQSVRDQIRRHDVRLREFGREHSAKLDEWELERRALVEAAEAAAEAAQAARWEGAIAWSDQVLKAGQATQPGRSLLAEIPRAAVEQGSTERLVRIAEVQTAVAARDTAQASWQQALDAEAAAQARYVKADAEVAAVAGQVGAARRAAAEAVLLWAARSQRFIPPQPLVERLADALLRFTAPGGTPHDLLQGLRPHLAERAETLQAATLEARERLRTAQTRHGALRAERQALEQAPPEPVRTEEQQRARAALAAAGLSFAPLYETLDLPDQLSPGQAAQLEEALAQMGLLDALVVPPADRQRARHILLEQGLGERWLAPVDAGPSPGATLSALLEADAMHALANQAAGLLGQIGAGGGDQAVVGTPGVAADGTWRHGLLEGTAGVRPTARFIGRSARERFRQQELARVDHELAQTAGVMQREQNDLLALAQQQAQLADEWAELQGLPALNDLHTLSGSLELLRQAAQREQKALEEAGEVSKARRSAWDREEAALLGCYGAFPAAAGLSRAGLELLAQATQQVRGAYGQLHASARLLEAHSDALERIQAQITSETERRDEREEAADELHRAVGRLQGRLTGLKQILEQPGAQAVFDRLSAISADLDRLKGEEQKFIGQEAVADNDVQRLQHDLPTLHSEAQVAGRAAEDGRLRLRAAVETYPTLHAHVVPTESHEGARQVARTLLSRYVERPNLAEEIRAQEMKDRSTLSELYTKKRPELRHLFPEYQPTESGNKLLLFLVEGTAMTPVACLEHLQGQLSLLQTVLQQDEADLFERHLLQEVGREVRRCLLKARDWVDEINELLALHPLRNAEQVHLEWEPKRTEHELGGSIARHANLLWIDEAHLTGAQRDSLKGAFQEEIRLIREQAKRDGWRADVFREKLGEVLDYRNWFRFRIFVLGGVAGKTEITDTAHNARSGSERALVLLFPLIAGLSVRYDSGASDAPRLLGLDEVFAGIDALNSRQLLKFLSALRLTWVVTSEKQPAMTEELSGASLYSMLREGTVVATRAFFWDGYRLRDPEQEWGEGDNAR